MQQKNNPGESKRKTDERIWRENEYMGRVLDEKVRELDKLKTKFEKKLAKEKEKFAVQHMNVNSIAAVRGGRRKKISLTVEPYKFLLEPKVDKDRNTDTFSLSHDYKLSTRSTSVPNLAQLEEKDKGDRHFLPPLCSSKDKMRVRSKENLKPLASEGKQTGRSRRLDQEAGLREKDAVNTVPKQSETQSSSQRDVTLRVPVGYLKQHRKSLQKDRNHAAAETFITDTHEYKPRKTKLENRDITPMQPKLFGQLTLIDEISNRDKLDRKYFSESARENMHEQELKSESRRSSCFPINDASTDLEVLDSVRKNKLAPLELHVHYTASSLSDQTENKTRTSRRQSRVENVGNFDSNNNSWAEHSSGFGSVGRVSMVKNLAKKQQLELEHQISFLPARSGIFREGHVYTNNNGGELNEQDNRRVGVAKKRWFKAYKMAKQNFYGHEHTEKPAANLVDKTNTAKDSESCSKDPRLLRLVSLLCKRKNLPLSDEKSKDERY